MSAVLGFILASLVTAGVAPPFLSDLDVARAEAAKSGRPSFVQFTAAWCEPCQEMKEQVFPHPQVSPRLESFVRVAVDIETDAGKEAWMHYALPGLPVMSFLKADGEEVKSLRVTGMPDLPDFVVQLDKALEQLEGSVAGGTPGAGPARKGLPWWWIAVGGAATLAVIGALALRAR